MNSQLIAIFAFALLAFGTFAGDLTLTGLIRHRGQSYAYLSSGKSSECFSLKLGQEVANLKLESVDFKKGEAVVVAGDERLVLALERRSKESATVEAPAVRPHFSPGTFPQNRNRGGNGPGPMAPGFPMQRPAPPPQHPVPENGAFQGIVPDAPPIDSVQTLPAAGAEGSMPGRPAVSPIPIAIQSQGVTSPDDPPPEPTDH